jgi:hypothetical protein
METSPILPYSETPFPRPVSITTCFTMLFSMRFDYCSDLFQFTMYQQLTCQQVQCSAEMKYRTCSETVVNRAR